MGQHGFKWVQMGSNGSIGSNGSLDTVVHFLPGFGNFWAILGRALMMMCEDILLHVAGRDWLSKA